MRLMGGSNPTSIRLLRPPALLLMRQQLKLDIRHCCICFPIRSCTSILSTAILWSAWHLFQMVPLKLTERVWALFPPAACSLCEQTMDEEQACLTAFLQYRFPEFGSRHLLASSHHRHPGSDRCAHSHLTIRRSSFLNHRPISRVR